VTRAQDVVQQFRGKGDDIRAAMFELCGGWSSTALRKLELSDEVFDAVVEGTRDPHSRVRSWCITILDHVADPRAIAAIEPLLDDPVPRNRRNAAHALGCVLCKPEWSGDVKPETLAKLEHLAVDDPNARVRRDASIALLGCRRHAPG
jgi:HEAT repeat protein